MIRAFFSSKWLLMFSLGSFRRLHRYRVAATLPQKTPKAK